MGEESCGREEIGSHPQRSQRQCSWAGWAAAWHGVRACGLWVPGLAYTSLALWPLPQLCCPPFIRYFFNKEGDFNNLTAAAYHRKTHLLVTGFASGIFHLHELPEFNLIHSLRWAPLLCVAASSAGRGTDRPCRACPEHRPWSGQESWVAAWMASPDTCPHLWPSQVGGGLEGIQVLLPSPPSWTRSPLPWALVPRKVSRREFSPILMNFFRFLSPEPREKFVGKSGKSAP